MAARLQQQEINTFSTVLSLLSVQFHNQRSNRPRPGLMHICIKCTCYLLSVRSVDCHFLGGIFFHTVFDLNTLNTNTTYIFRTFLKMFIFYQRLQRLASSFNIYLKTQQSSAENTNNYLFAENNSGTWQVLFPTKYAKIHLLQGRDPPGVRAMFSKCACLDLSEGLGLGIFSCRPCLLSSCLGSDASPVCPCEAQQTPPISPSTTETTGAFQQLDLMQFHHQRG